MHVLSMVELDKQIVCSLSVLACSLKVNSCGHCPPCKLELYRFNLVTFSMTPSMNKTHFVSSPCSAGLNVWNVHVLSGPNNSQ